MSNLTVQLIEQSAELITTYHLDALYHGGGSICSFHSIMRPDKENCLANPNCIYDLLDNPPALPRNSNADRENQSKQVSIKDSAVKYMGLQNLGVTCYMNSVLQTFFSIPTFRNAVFEWLQTKNIDSDAAMQELQFLFGTLETGIQKSFKPIEFATKLGLNLGIQQDAEEFYQLLLSFIEEKFEERESLKDAVKRHFVGEQVFETTCQTCHKKTLKSESFNKIGLNIEGRYSLMDMFRHLQQPEIVDDYACDNCALNRRCSRVLKFKQFPPFLTLQLFRFVYDRRTGMREKLFDDIHVPHDLDMGFYLASEYRAVFENEYVLHAVICHLGSNSHAGHYVCYIHDDGYWRLDDSEATRVHSWENPFARNFTEPHLTHTPYLLIYRKKTETIRNIRSLIPESVRALVEHQGDLVRIESKEKEEKNQREARDNEFMKDQRKDLFRALRLNFHEHLVNEYNHCWIELDWLKECVADYPLYLRPIDNTKLLCAHQKLALDTTKMKKIPKKTFEMLVEKYGGGPMLTCESMCHHCVEERFAQLRKERAASERRKEIIRMVDQSYMMGAIYCINKKWYRDWKEKTIKDFDFVKDLTCEHGGFAVSNYERDLFVTDSVFNYYKEEFNMPHARKFTEKDRCIICVEQNENVKQVERKIECDKLMEKQNLLYTIGHLENKRPYLRVGSHFIVVSKAWHKRWLVYVKDAKSSVQPGPINKDIVCEHGKLEIDISLDRQKKEDHQEVYLMDLDDWNQRLLNYYPDSIKVTFTITKHERASHFSESTLEIEGVSNPGICEVCLQKRELRKLEEEKYFRDVDLKLTRKMKYTYSSCSYRISASHDTTVMQFKLQIYEAADVLPYLQLLTTTNGKSLDDENLTLGDYGVTAHTEFVLTALTEDEALAQLMLNTQPTHKEHSAEVGFDGSLLLKKPTGSQQPKPDMVRDTSTGDMHVIGDATNNHPTNGTVVETMVVEKPKLSLSNSSDRSNNAMNIEEPIKHESNANLDENDKEYRDEHFQQLDRQVQQASALFVSEKQLREQREREKQQAMEVEQALVWPSCRFCTYNNLDAHYVRLKMCEVCGEVNP